MSAVTSAIINNHQSLRPGHVAPRHAKSKRHISEMGRFATRRCEGTNSINQGVATTGYRGITLACWSTSGHTHQCSLACRQQMWVISVVNHRQLITINAHQQCHG